jgi:hypothetical protein
MTAMLYVGFYTHPDYHAFDLTNLASVHVVRMRNGGICFKLTAHLSDRVFYCKRLEFMTVMAKKFYGADCKLVA